MLASKLMDGYEWDAAEEPAWMREPMAWVACLANALPIAVVLAALARELVERPSAVMALAIYVGVFTVWVLAARPWSVRPAIR